MCHAEEGGCGSLVSTLHLCVDLRLASELFMHKRKKRKMMKMEERKVVTNF